MANKLVAARKEQLARRAHAAAVNPGSNPISIPNP